MESYHFKRWISKIFVLAMIISMIAPGLITADGGQMDEEKTFQIIPSDAKNSSENVDNCAIYNGNCGNCLKDDSCFYCGQTQACRSYQKHSDRQSLFKARSQCSKGNIYIYQCKMNLLSFL